MNKLATQTRFHMTSESHAGASNGGFGTLNSAAAPVDTDQDGMPDFYETALGWNPASQDHNTALANSGGVITGTTFMPAGTVAGYTRLEEYLHYLAIPHGTVAKNISGTPTSIQVDLRKFTIGLFLVSGIHDRESPSAAAVALSGTGNYLVTFTPTANYVGRARFDFTVTDGAGHSVDANLRDAGLRNRTAPRSQLEGRRRGECVGHRDEELDAQQHGDGLQLWRSCGLR